MLKKDKQKVIGEELSDARIKSMLDLRDERGDVSDLHLLTRAYRALRADDFERFVHFFCTAGHDVNATDASGRSFLKIISKHDQATHYTNILTAAGANK